MDKGFSKYNKGGNGYGKREKYNNTKNYSGNNSNKDYIPYIGAPYNFVPLTKKPYELRGGTIAHNDSDSNLLSGEISVRVEAISPILISDGKDHFYRDAYNRIAIPGSSFRGLIRNSVQILGAANVCDDIEDYKFLFREMFNKGINNDRYKNILGIIPIEPKIVDGTIRSVVKNVKAGFIVKTGKGYCIRSPKEDVTKYTGDTNYFSVYDRDIV